MIRLVDAGKIAFIIASCAFLYFLPAIAPDADAHEAVDQQFLTETFDGVWVIAATEEPIRIRTESSSLSILIDDVFLCDASIIDIDRPGRAVTIMNREGVQLTFTRFGDYLKLSGDDRIYRAQRSRRLSPSDNELLDLWLNPPMSKCGLFNQRCQ